MEGQALLEVKITCEWARIHYFIPESKRSSVTKYMHHTKKLSTQLSAGKIMAIVFRQSEIFIRVVSSAC
jgi:hypothetical protein